MSITNMLDLDLRGKRVMIREDFNVPIKDGVITDDTRIRACIPTIQTALRQEARIILISHLGRPKEGQYDKNLTLLPVAQRLETLLHQPIHLEKDWLNGLTVGAGKIVLCENVRFNIGEEANDELLARKMAALCDIFVMDAFGTAHRA
ncbi:MAG: phosphoglycerate kinase, partial [Pseudomonadota bacterium]|nr:phosphoglycerate kinase [Pseudomonadota bacterium]